MQTVKGTRDIMPEDMLLKEYVVSKLKQVFELYGFLPMETPALESWDLLSAKGVGGQDVLNEAYDFEDKGGRRIGLRYEFTVSLARVMASNSDMSLPFKRYQTGKIWRYGDVSKARFREFSQFDADIVGSNSSLADAEIISCAIDCFKALGFEKFCIRLSNRKILTSLAKYAKVSEKNFNDVFTIIDKLDKVGIKEVEKQLCEKISKQSAKKIIDFISIKGNNKEVLDSAESVFKCDGIDELRDVLSSVNDSSKIKVDFSLARGLSYYTGPIFEVFGSKDIGSLGGGGRYDKLIGLFSSNDVPATGIGIGLDRTLEVMKEKKMVELSGKTKVFVVSVNSKVASKALEIVKDLRSNSIPTDYDLRQRSLSGQIKFASSMKIPFVIIVGPKELEKESVTLRNMKTGKEETVKIKEISKKF